MKHIRIHIGWFWIGIILLMLTACSSSGDDMEGQQPPVAPGQQPTMLTIYVYSPDKPIMTRADVGPVSASEVENVVTNLQLWIFDTSGNKVGYLNTTETATLNSGNGAIYQIPVSDDFAENKPNVDVYVMANVTANNCGITTTLDENTNREVLLAQAKITIEHYGLTATGLTTEVPDDGLPMAGVLKNQPVVGDAPVLRIGTTDNIARVPLTRAVSKLHFFFANTDGAPQLNITGITLSAGTIPDMEYLFPQNQALTYNTAATSILTSTIEAVEVPASPHKPADYIYNGQTAQEYEELMTGALLSDELSGAGPYYLRESDKRVEGTITYTVEGITDTQSATFKMAEMGDFLRNHSWIVYAYYEGLSGLQVKVVDVTPWTDKEEDHEVYNW